MNDLITAGSSATVGCSRSGVLGSMPTYDSSARAVNRSFMLTSDLKHFIDMVYLYAVQSGFVPVYVCGADFKSNIDDIRKFDRLADGDSTAESQNDKSAVSKSAYAYALIVYGFIKELAVAGNSEAARVYDVLKQLMPYKIY